MSPMQKPPLTPDADSPGISIEAELDVLRETLYEIAYHDEPTSPDIYAEIEGAVTSLLRVAEEARWKRRTSKAREGRYVISLGEVIARAMRHLRDAADLTQQQVADLMGRAGFTNWKRITVAEVESGKRAVSIEEMIAVAALFDVPVCYLLTAFLVDEVVEVNERLALTAAQAQELIADERVEDAWLGLRLSPTISGPLVLGESEDDPWRPSVWESSRVQEAQEGTMVLRVETAKDYDNRRAYRPTN